jgi:hypothetical protein
MRAVVYRKPFEIALEEARRVRDVITEGWAKPSLVVPHELPLVEASGAYQKSLTSVLRDTRRSSSNPASPDRRRRCSS